MTFQVALEAGRTTMAASPPPASEQDQLAQAAKQFEAIFLRQMLASARATDLGGDDDLFGGNGEETFREMRDARFAEIASETGAIGLADVIEKQLARFTGQGL